MALFPSIHAYICSVVIYQVDITGAAHITEGQTAVLSASGFHVVLRPDFFLSSFVSHESGYQYSRAGSSPNTLVSTLSLRDMPSTTVMVR